MTSNELQESPIEWENQNVPLIKPRRIEHYSDGTSLMSDGKYQIDVDKSPLVIPNGSDVIKQNPTMEQAKRDSLQYGPNEAPKRIPQIVNHEEFQQ